MLTEQQRAVLSRHLVNDETEADTPIEDDAEWNELCSELLQQGLLEWLPTYEHIGQATGWGVQSKTVTYTRVLTAKGRAALKEKTSWASTSLHGTE